MSDDTKRVQPYKSLGERLKRLREKSRESLAEVSGAVEIDIEALERYEAGYICPTEDILLLLISHFSIKDEEATKLWKLAGYEKHELPVNDEESVKSVVILPADARVHYTDMVHVMANNYGVVINFMQSSGPNNQPLVISRLGMSKDHTKSVIGILQKSLEQSEPKSLPATTKKSKRTQRKTDNK